MIRRNQKKTMTRQQTVVHHYHDYASVIADDGATDETIFNDPKTSFDRNFPVKLHFVLRQLEMDDCSDIASWAPHGRCFVVHKPGAFETRILKKWFRQTKYTSFQRQLNLYGFNRITKGLDRHGYYHELFLRNKAFLSVGIKRMKVKGCGARKASAPEHEPNFYNMTSLPSLRLKPWTPPSTDRLLSFASTIEPIAHHDRNPHFPLSLNTTLSTDSASKALLESAARHLSLSLALELERDVAARYLQASRYPSYNLSSPFALPSTTNDLAGSLDYCTSPSLAFPRSLPPSSLHHDQAAFQAFKRST